MIVTADNVQITVNETIAEGYCRQYKDGNVVYTGPIGESLEESITHIEVCEIDYRFMVKKLSEAGMIERVKPILN